MQPLNAVGFVVTACSYVCVHVCTYVHTHTCTHTHARTHVQTHTHLQLQTHTHTHTHTHNTLTHPPAMHSFHKGNFPSLEVSKSLIVKLVVSMMAFSGDPSTEVTDLITNKPCSTLSYSVHFIL